MSTQFVGFRPEALDFLAELALNNERTWFQPRKAAFESLLKEPLERLCVDLDEAFRAQGIPLSADPVQSPFRIYRDVRFSKDKSPYKTALGASFPWLGDGGGVGGYLHFEPAASFVGGGMWHPERERLATWRRTIVDDRARVHAALEDASFRSTFGQVNGDRLKRGPTGFAPDDPDIELLKLKDVTFGRPLSDEEALSPDLVATLAETLSAGVPVLRLLAGLSTVAG